MLPQPRKRSTLILPGEIPDKFSGLLQSVSTA
uniref:Uncharacterized protein n=1 Tax=Arundo donax TaxID=35708 RepID=A0A0A9AT91_ARUDO